MKHLAPISDDMALPLDWRWQRAKLLRTPPYRRRARRREDVWVQMAFNFQEALWDSGTSDDYLARGMPGIYYAWMLRGDADAGKAPPQAPTATRWAVEAYLCAEDELSEIAHKCGTSPETLLSYTKLFFDVAGKTCSLPYLLNKVLGPAIERGIHARQFDLLWKLFGILRGPHFVDYLIRSAVTVHRLESPIQVRVACDELIRDSLGVKALFAARTIPVEGNEDTIIGCYRRLVELEAADDGADRNNAIMNSVAAMMKQLQFCRLDPFQETETPGPYVIGGGIEMRAGETMHPNLAYWVKQDPMIKDLLKRSTERETPRPDQP